MDRATDIHIIEEATNVKENDRRNQTGLDGGLGVVYQTKGCVDSAVIFARSELGGREDVVMVDVVEDVFGNDFLQQFPAAFKEGDGTIGFGKGIVGFGRLGDYNNKGVRPPLPWSSAR